MNETPDGLTATIDYLASLPDWARYLADDLSREEEARLGYFTETGFPMGAPDWLSAMETKSSRNLRPRPRGRPRLDTD
ncbi:hypothetical protein [Maricaulis maris]|uniref:hypothetical protein n=1 Tax=Maricaulis maris TaxID=74318 RepID=UPI003B8D504C